MGVFIGMNTKRKFLQLVDLRVQRYFAGRKGVGFPTAEREQVVEVQVVESRFKGLGFTDGAVRSSAL